MRAQSNVWTQVEGNKPSHASVPQESNCAEAMEHRGEELQLALCVGTALQHSPDNSDFGLCTSAAGQLKPHLLQ